MKKKDITYAILAAAILAVVAVLGYKLLVPHKAASAQAATTVVVITPIDSSLNQSSLNQLTDTTQTQDFAIQLGLSGLGNSNPFGG